MRNISKESVKFVYDNILNIYIYLWSTIVYKSESLYNCICGILKWTNTCVVCGLVTHVFYLLSLYIYVYTAYIKTDRLPHITQFETPSFYKGGGGLTSSSRKGEVGLKGGLLRKGGIFCFDMKFL